MDRYLSGPGQALDYRLCELAIVRLRAQAERELGKRLDIKAFHDAVRGPGSVPLPLLDQQLQASIAASKAKALAGTG